MPDRSTLAKQFLTKILPSGGVEAVLDEGTALESLAESARLRAPEEATVRSTLEKIALDQELSGEDQFILEAIIIPDQRPAIDVVGGNFEVRHPLWQHYATDPIKAQIRKALPSIGRLEISGIPNLPYGGTGFVVGPGLLMTNRHVAQLFSSGLGRQGLSFRAGLGAGIDFKRERGRSETQLLRIRRVLMIHPFWDMALLQVDGLSSRNPPLVLSLESPDQLVGRDIAVIGYPAFDPRNPADVQNRVFGGLYYVKRLQPGKLGLRRATRSFDHTVSAITHDSSTLGGNSGSAVVDVQSGTVVALHFGGLYLDANFAVPAWELARDQHVIAAGVRFRGSVPGDAAVTNRWWSSVESVEPPPPPDSAPSPRGGDTSTSSLTLGDGATWTIPLQVTVRLGAGGQTATVSATAPADSGASPELVERMVAPVTDPDYSTREGYSESFLGTDVPLPEPVDPDLCALQEDGSPVLPYHHFSLVMHKLRRLAMFTAANLDASPARKRPEAGRSYSRKALGGLGKNDMELWLTDPRISSEEQLPDRFFSKDKGAFDRGHVVRREDVAWGDSYQEVQFANGDTFHTTNCSPQVAGFNQSASSENWGDLENYVSSQAGVDRLSLFAGPVLADDDPIFVGVDDDGPVRVRIPQQFWKVILAEEEGELRAFAFLLRQDLSDVPLEFAVSAAWLGHMISVTALEDLLGTVRFPDVVRLADQAETAGGEAVRALASIDLLDAPAPVSLSKGRAKGRVREIEMTTPNSGDDSYAEPGIARMPRYDDSLAATEALEAPVTWRVAKSLLALRQQVNTLAPQRSKASDGTIGDAAHATRSSDHNPWVQDGGTGVVTALDVTHDPAKGCDAGRLAESLRVGRDARIKYIIWNRKIASSVSVNGVAAWTWRPYAGSNPHTKHVHISVRPEKATYDSEAAWVIRLA